MQIRKLLPVIWQQLLYYFNNLETFFKQNLNKNEIYYKLRSVKMEEKVDEKWQ